MLTPIQYHGQKERDDYVQARILLDGADGTIGQQRLVDVPLDQIRTGMRVEAVWADRSDERGRVATRGARLGDAITGGADRRARRAARARYEEHML